MAMEFVIFEESNILSSIRVSQTCMALPLPLLECPFINVSILKFNFSRTMEKAIFKLSHILKLLSVMAYQSSLAIRLIILKFSFIFFEGGRQRSVTVPFTTFG